MPNRDYNYKEGLPQATRRVKRFTPYRSLPQGSSGDQAFRKGKHLTSDGKQKRLACPYRKKHPQCKPKAPSCLHPFPNISRLKEHLYRCHMEQHQCLRCRATFESQAILERHMQAINICQPCQQREPQVFGRDVQNILKKREPGKSNEEKWIGVYRTLFPNDTDIPLPYHDELPLAEYRERAWNRLPGRLEFVLRALAEPLTGTPLLSESVIGEVIKVARACNDDLVQEFQNEQQHESAQDQSLELSTGRPSPPITPTNTSPASERVESTDGQEDTMSSGHTQQLTFANMAMPSTSEFQSYLDGTASGCYGNYPSTAMMNFDWDSEETATYAPTSSQAWYGPGCGSTNHVTPEGIISSTDARVMQFLPTLPEDLMAVQAASLPSTFTAMDATGFTADMLMGTSQTAEPAFQI